MSTAHGFTGICEFITNEAVENSDNTTTPARLGAGRGFSKPGGYSGISKGSGTTGVCGGELADIAAVNAEVRYSWSTLPPLRCSGADSGSAANSTRGLTAALLSEPGCENGNLSDVFFRIGVGCTAPSASASGAGADSGSAAGTDGDATAPACAKGKRPEVFFAIGSALSLSGEVELATV